MYICLCKRITDTQIRAAVQGGAGSLSDVQSLLGVASQCGKCGSLATDIVREMLLDAGDSDQLFYAAG